MVSIPHHSEKIGKWKVTVDNKWVQQIVLSQAPIWLSDIKVYATTPSNVDVNGYIARFYLYEMKYSYQVSSP